MSTHCPESPQDTARHRTFWTLAVALAACAVFAHTLTAGFTYDDDKVIAANESIRSIDGALRAFTQTEWSGAGTEIRQYRPLTTLTYALNFAVSGLAPWSYHLANILLHAVVSILVLRLGLLWRLPLQVAGAGALLFAVHPIHTEAVANVVGRKDVLTTLFLIAMALSHRWALRRPCQRAWLPALAYGAAMFSKEIGVVGIVLVFAQDLIGTNASLRRAIPESHENLCEGGSSTQARGLACLYAAYCLEAVAYLLLFFWVTAAAGPSQSLNIENPAAVVNTSSRLMTALAVLGKGLMLQILPMRQSPDYSFNAIPVVTSLLDWRFLGSVALLMSWLVVAVRTRRQQPQVLLALAWYGGTVLPVSNLVVSIGTIFGERLLYAPSAGVTLLAGLTLAAIGRRTRPWVAVAALAVATVGLAAKTVVYAAAWSDNSRLFRLAVRNQPDSAPVHLWLAGEALSNGRYDDAVSLSRRALEIAPDFDVASVVLAEAFRAQGRFRESRTVLAGVLRRNPSNTLALHAMGLALRDEGFPTEAAKWFERAVDSNPRYAPSLDELGGYYLAQGATDRGLAYCERAVQADPSLPRPWWNMAIAYRARGDVARTRDAFRHFIEVAGPEYAQQAAYARRALSLLNP